MALQDSTTRTSPWKRCVWLALVCVFLPLCADQSNAIEESLVEGDVADRAYTEDFESPITCFEVHRPDSPAHKLIAHTRTDTDHHLGQASEMARYAIAHGTHYYFRYQIKPAHLIAEFSPGIWIKSTKPGITLSARVVLPATEDPTSDGPMTALIGAPIYENTGRWEQLSFKSLRFNARELLNQQAVVLGRKYEMPIDTSGAYVDAILLNMYTEAGETTTWIDDLTIEGAIPLDSVKVAAEQNAERVADPSDLHQAGLKDSDNDDQDGVMQAAAIQDIADDVQVSGRKLFVDGQPFHVRMIRSQGEPFERLRELGFNTVFLKSTPGASELELAREHDLWIVCPPPPTFDIGREPNKYARVLCWSLGENLAERDIELARRKASTLRQTDPLNRPILCSATSSSREFARFCDLLIFDLQVTGTSFDLNQIGRWVSRKRELSGSTIPFLITVQSEYPQVLQNQIAAFDGSAPFLPVEHIELQKMVWAAASAGDGIFFTSRRSLEASDPQSRFRAKSIKWINGQLQQLEPWFAAGTVTRRIATNDPNVFATLFATEKSNLMLVNRRFSNLDSGGGFSPSIHVRDATFNLSNRVFRVDDSGFTPVATERNRSGATIRIENFSQTGAFVITGDAATIRYLSDSEPLNASLTLFEQHRELTAGYTALVNHTLAELSQLGQGSNQAHRDIENVLANLAQSDRLFKSNNRAAALAGLERADRLLHAVWQKELSGIQKHFHSPVASPLVQHFATLPAHYRFMKRVREGMWSANILPAGDFENFRRLTDSGWKQSSSELPGIESSILLTDASPVAGESALHFRAWREANDTAGNSNGKAAPQIEIDGMASVERSPVWITTSPVNVRAGQIIRVHGFAKINREIVGSPDGFMIIDSIGGPQLASRYTAENGWQQFSIYRMAESNDPFQLTFALTGLGEAIVDELTIRTYESTGDRAGDKVDQSSDATEFPRQKR